MRREDYLEWVQQVVEQLARKKYPDNPNLQQIHQLGMLTKALADLCYIDSDNMHRVNAMFKRNMDQPGKPFKPKREQH